MGMLSAFLRGAAGPGLLDMGARMDRRDELEQAAQARRAALDEERKFRAEQAELDRRSREDVAGIRKGGSKSSSGSGGGDGAGDDNYALAAIMEKYGVSEAKARAMLESSRTDQSPFQNREVADESGGHGAPDVARWAELNRTIAKAMREGPSMGRSNIEQVRNAEGQEQRNTIGGGMLAGKLTPAQAAEGIAATKGEGAYGRGGVNTFDGTPDAVGKSTIAENNAQAGSANRANRSDDPLAKLPPGVKARIDLIKKRADQINGAITKAQADGMWDTGQNPAQAGLVSEFQKLDAEARDLLKPYIPEQPKAKADPVQARREAEAAVSAGAPLDRVNARLKEMGLEPIEAPAKAAKPAEGKKGPSMIDRISMGIGDAVDAARSAMDVKAQIKARVAEAKAGGKPLTPGEKQLAEKHGVAV